MRRNVVSHAPVPGRSGRSRPRKTWRALVVAFTCAFILVGGPVARAADGEVGDVGDTDSITDLYVSDDGRIHALIDYARDCAAGLTGCEIQVRFGYRCPQRWCTHWSWQTWRRIPLSNGGASVAKGDCNGGDEIDNEWQMEYRMRWWASTVKTVTFKGEYETYLGSGGTIMARVIAEGVHNVTNGTGLIGHATLDTRTALGATSPGVQVATTGGRIHRTC